MQLEPLLGFQPLQGLQLASARCEKEKQEIESEAKPKERREAPTCCRETTGSRLRRDVPHIPLKALVGKVTRLVEMCHHATPVARTR